MSRVDLTRWCVDERAFRAMALTRAGESGREIAVRLGVSRRTVERYRARARRQTGARP